MFNIKLARQARTDDTCISSRVVSLSHTGDRLISGQFYGCPRGTCFLLKLDSRCAEIFYGRDECCICNIRDSFHRLRACRLIIPANRMAMDIRLCVNARRGRW